MFKLRGTWSAGKPPIFANDLLYGLDTEVRKIDPAWPVTAKKPEVAAAVVAVPSSQPAVPPTSAAVTDDEPQTPTAIHVNPRFLVQVRVFLTAKNKANK